MSEPTLPQKIVALHKAFEARDLPHAFGGALALAWCTRDARGTHDIDLNILVPPARIEEGLAALPGEVEITDEERRTLARDGQVRLWWGRTPVDLFFATTTFHLELIDRLRWESSGDVALPYLDCNDLAVFKAFFDREKDWFDMGEMLRAHTLEVRWVLGTLVQHLGGDDHRVERLRSLSACVEDETPQH